MSCLNEITVFEISYLDFFGGSISRNMVKTEILQNALFVLKLKLRSQLKFLKVETTVLGYFKSNN